MNAARAGDLARRAHLPVPGVRGAWRWPFSPPPIADRRSPKTARGAGAENRIPCPIKKMSISITRYFYIDTTCAHLPAMAALAALAVCWLNTYRFGRKGAIHHTRPAALNMSFYDIN